MSDDRIEILDKDFAEEYCYGCPCFRHDGFINKLYCRRKIDKILCEVLDGSYEVHPVEKGS